MKIKGYPEDLSDEEWGKIKCFTEKKEKNEDEN